jgi:hypothetical protein
VETLIFDTIPDIHPVTWPWAATCLDVHYNKSKMLLELKFEIQL